MSDTLLCWHAERAGLEVLEGALGKLTELGVQVSRVIYLVQAQSAADIPPSIGAAHIEPIRISLPDPLVTRPSMTRSSARNCPG